MKLDDFIEYCLVVALVEIAAITLCHFLLPGC